MTHEESGESEPRVRRMHRIPDPALERDPFRRQILEVAHDVLSEYGTVELVAGPCGPGGFGETVDVLEDGGGGGASAGASAAAPTEAPRGAPPAAPAAAPTVLARDSEAAMRRRCDVGVTTPFLVGRAAAALRRKLYGRGPQSATRELETLVLLDIGRRGRASTMAVARRLGVPVSTTYSVVERLERRGEITRGGGGRDRRRRLLGLTEAGRARAETAARRYEEVDGILLATMAPVERDRLRLLLRGLLQVLGSA